jgi:hypothetical protein
MKRLHEEKYKNHSIEIYERITRRDDVRLGLSYSDEIIYIDGVQQMRSGPSGESALDEAKRLIDETEEDIAYLYSNGSDNPHPR